MLIYTRLSDIPLPVILTLDLIILVALLFWRDDLP